MLTGKNLKLLRVRICFDCELNVGDYWEWMLLLVVESLVM
jgi:hypothetical protein